MKATKTISISSGKGGVGKTTLVTNLAYELASQGKKVLVFDGDFGMANADIMFGVRAQFHILDVIQERIGLDEVILSVDQNIDLIPGGSGVYEYNRLNSFERRALLSSLEKLNGKYDYFIVDTAPGLADHVLYLNAAAETPVIVVTPDPSSITDAYALIKVLNTVHKVERVSIICNQVKDSEDGLNLYKRFNDVVNRFLFIGLDYLGSVPLDTSVRRATIQQRLILKQFPDADASRGIRQIAGALRSQEQLKPASSGLQFFWEQVVGVA